LSFLETQQLNDDREQQQPPSPECLKPPRTSMSVRRTATTSGQAGKETNEACLDACTSPYDIVGPGLDRERLCENGSEFREAYGGCIDCVKESAAQAGVAVSQLIPSLAPVVSQCSDSAVTSTLTIVKPDGDVSTMVFLVYESSSSATSDGESRPPGVTQAPGGPGGRPGLPWVTWTGTPFWGRGPPPWITGSVPWGAGPPPWLTLATLTGAPECPPTTVSMFPDTASFMSQWCTGPWAAAQITPAPSTSSASTSTSAPTTTPPTDGFESEPSNSSDTAWIAGPVIGSVFGLAVILGMLFFWRRRRRSQAAAHASSELDAEKPPAEMSHQVAYEMEGSSPIDLYVEKPANEYPGKELGG
jgi:hypothetical protein